MAEEKIPLESPKGKEPLGSPVERREEARRILENRIRAYGSRRFIGHEKSEELSSRILNLISSQEKQQEKLLFVLDSYTINLEALRSLWHRYPSTDKSICETMSKIFSELPPPYLLEESDRVNLFKQKMQDISQYIETLSPWPMFRTARKYLQELQAAWIFAEDNYSRRASAFIPMGEKYYHMDLDDARKNLSVMPNGRRIKEISTGMSSVCELGGMHCKSGHIPSVDGERSIAEEDSSAQFRREDLVSTLLQFLAGSPFVVAPVRIIDIQGVPILSLPRDGSQPTPITIGGPVLMSLSIKGMDLKTFLQLRAALETWRKILVQDFEWVMKDAKTDFEEILKVTKSKFPHIFQENFDRNQSEALRKVIENLSEEDSIDQAKDIHKIKRRDDGARKTTFYDAFNFYFKERGGAIENVYILIGLMHQFPSLMKGRNVMGQLLDSHDKGLSMSLLSEVHNIRALFKPIFIEAALDGTQNKRSLFDLLSTDSVLEACQKIAELLMELDEESSCALILSSILALLGDGKGDNFILEFFVHDGKLKCRLVAIDTEKSLRMPVRSVAQPSEELSQMNKLCLTIKNSLFLLPEIMKKPLHPKVRERILAFSAEHEILSWLCFSAGLGREQIELSGQVICFLKENFEKLQNIVRGDADITPDECLKKLDPVVWAAYRALPILTVYELFFQDLEEKNKIQAKKLNMQLQLIKSTCQHDPERQEAEELKAIEAEHQRMLQQKREELKAQIEWSQLQEQLEKELLEIKKELEALQLMKKEHELAELQAVKVKYEKIEYQLYAWQWLQEKVIALTERKLPARYKLQIHQELYENYPSPSTLEDALYWCGDQYDLRDLIGQEAFYKPQEDSLTLFYHAMQEYKKSHEMPINAAVYCLAQIREHIRWTALKPQEVWEYVQIFCLLPPHLNTPKLWEETWQKLGKGDIKKEDMKFLFQSWLEMAIIQASPLVAQTMIYYFGADINFSNLRIQRTALHEFCIRCKDYPDFETAELMATLLFTDPSCQPYHYSKEGSLLLSLMTYAGELNDLSETQTEIVLYVFDALVKGGANLEARNVRNETLVDEFLKSFIQSLEKSKRFSDKKVERVKITWFVELVKRGAGVHADETLIYDCYKRYSKLGIMVEGFEEAINTLKKRNLGLSGQFILEKLKVESSSQLSQIEGVKLGGLYSPAEIQRSILMGSSRDLNFKIDLEDECAWQLTYLTNVEEVKNKEAYYILYRLLSGRLIEANDFLIIRKQNGNLNLAEISQTVPGKTLLQVLKGTNTTYSSPRCSRAVSMSQGNQPFGVNTDNPLSLRLRNPLMLNLNEKELSALFIVAIALNLNIGPENCKLVLVDGTNESLGYRIIFTNKEDSYQERPGCILFYFKEMLDSVHYQVREQIIFQSFSSIYQEYAMVFEEFLKKFGALLKMKIKSELPEFGTLKATQEIIKKNANISHLGLLKAVRPSWREYYNSVLKTQPDSARILSLYEESSKILQNTDMQGSVSRLRLDTIKTVLGEEERKKLRIESYIGSLLKGNFDCFTSNSSKFKELEEDLFNEFFSKKRGNAVEVLDEFIKQKINFKKICIHSCLLTDFQLENLLTCSESLKNLELVDCPNLTDSISGIIEKKCINSLETLVLSQLTIFSIDSAGSLSGGEICISFKLNKATEIRITNNIQLRIITLEVPRAKIADFHRNPDLETIQLIDSKKIHDLDVRFCTKVTDSLVLSTIETFDTVPCLFLEGCIKMGSSFLYHMSKSNSKLFLQLTVDDLKNIINKVNILMNYKEVVISSSEFESIDLVIEMIGFILIKSKKLKELIVNFSQVKNNEVIDKLVEVVVTGIMSAGRLQWLDISSVFLTAKHWDRFIEALDKNTVLKTIYIMLEEFLESNARTLVTETLEDIIIISSEGENEPIMPGLIGFLQKKKGLNLFINGTNFVEIGNSILKIKGNNPIFDLSEYNHVSPIEDSRILVTASLLTTDTQTLIVDLSKNKLFENSIIAILNALMYNETVIALQLYDYGLSLQIADVLKKLLGKNKTILFIGLGLNFSKEIRKEIFDILMQRNIESPLPKDILVYLNGFYDGVKKSVNFHGFPSNELVPCKEMALALYNRDETGTVACFGPPNYQADPHPYDGRVLIEQPKVVYAKDQSKTVCTVIMLPNNLFATVGGNCTIIIWGLNTKEEIYTLKGHTATVRVMMSFRDNSIVSGSDDGFIRVWNELSKKYICSHAFNAHKGPVIAIINDDQDHIITACITESQVNFWQISNLGGYSFLYSLDLSSSGEKVTAHAMIKICGKRLAVGCSDGSIQIWNFERECIYTLYTNAGAVLALTQLTSEAGEMYGKFISCHGSNVKIWGWRQEKYECIRNLQIENKPTEEDLCLLEDVALVNKDLCVLSLCAISTNTILVGDNDGCIRILSLDEKSNCASRVLVTGFSPVSMVLQLSTGEIISGTEAGEVKIWSRFSPEKIYFDISFLNEWEEEMIVTQETCRLIVTLQNSESIETRRQKLVMLCPVINALIYTCGARNSPSGYDLFIKEAVLYINCPSEFLASELGNCIFALSKDQDMTKKFLRKANVTSTDDSYRFFTQSVSASEKLSTFLPASPSIGRSTLEQSGSSFFENRSELSLPQGRSLISSARHSLQESTSFSGKGSEASGLSQSQSLRQKPVSQPSSLSSSSSNALSDRTGSSFFENQSKLSLPQGRSLISSARHSLQANTSFSGKGSEASGLSQSQSLIQKPVSQLSNLSSSSSNALSDRSQNKTLTERFSFLGKKASSGASILRKDERAKSKEKEELTRTQIKH